jgi:hypothetical protein
MKTEQRATLMPQLVRHLARKWQRKPLWAAVAGLLGGGRVVPRGVYRASFVRRFNCTVASTASMRSRPAAMA